MQIVFSVLLAYTAVQQEMQCGSSQDWLQMVAKRQRSQQNRMKISFKAQIQQQIMNSRVPKNLFKNIRVLSEFSQGIPGHTIDEVTQSIAELVRERPKIEVVLLDNNTVCGICKFDMCDNQATLKCKHSAHTKCVAERPNHPCFLCPGVIMDNDYRKRDVKNIESSHKCYKCDSTSNIFSLENCTNYNPHPFCRNHFVEMIKAQIPGKDKKFKCNYCQAVICQSDLKKILNQQELKKLLN